jgi:hypothetical protein
VHGKSGAAAIMADIDRRYVDQLKQPSNFVDLFLSIAAVPSFPGLRRFPEGCGFKQWTRDDSKALMKVGSIPSYMIVS